MSASLLAAVALQCASPISGADVIGLARADMPFAQQSGYYGQVLGKHAAVASIPESGIHGAPLPNGETLRLGKAPDPADPRRKAFTFQLSPDDPSTSGSKRAEISFGHNVEHDKVYWAAFGVYVYDWGRLASKDASLFGIQLHSGDNSRNLSPSFGIYTTGGRTFRIEARASASSDPRPQNSVTRKYAEQPIPFGRWMNFVFRFRQNTGGSGFLQVWLDGKRIVDHRGSLGFSTPGYKDYFKFGYYNWSAFSSPRKVLVRSPLIVADPTGDKYRADDFMNQCIGGA